MASYPVISAMGTPEARLLESIRDMAFEMAPIQPGFPGVDRLESKFCKAYEKALNQAIAMPDAPPLAVLLVSQSGQRKIETMQMLGSEQPEEGPGDTLLHAPKVIEDLASLAAHYRQSVATQNVLASLGQAETVTPTTPVSVLHPEAPALFHPAQMLIGGPMVDFDRQYWPELIPGHPKLPWTNGTSTFLSLNITLPETVVATLSGTLLSDLIEYPPDILCNLLPHAIKLWSEIKIEKGVQRGGRLHLTLAPIRQTQWRTQLPDIDAIPGNASAQALVNLARTGEMI